MKTYPGYSVALIDGISKDKSSFWTRSYGLRLLSFWYFWILLIFCCLCSYAMSFNRSWRSCCHSNALTMLLLTMCFELQISFQVLKASSSIYSSGVEIDTIIKTEMSLLLAICSVDIFFHIISGKSSVSIIGLSKMMSSSFFLL